MDEECLTSLALGVVMGAILILIVVEIYQSKTPIVLSQETGDEICSNLAGNNSVATVSTSVPGKLICTIPTYDSSSNIIIKNNGEEK